MSPFTEDEREQRLRHLMEVYGDGLKRLCCVYLRDMGLAEDAVQETFIKAYDHIDELRQFPDVSKTNWAYYNIVEATNAHDYTKSSGTETWTNVTD